MVVFLALAATARRGHAAGRDAHAALVRRGRVVRDALAPARPGAAGRAPDRHRLPLVCGAEAPTGPPIVAVEGGPGLPVDRQPRRVPRDLRAAAAPARPAAGRQPRHRRLGADRLQERAVVHRAHVGPAFARRARALRAGDRRALRARRVGAVRHRLRGRRPRRGLRALRLPQGRPLRRLLRQLLRAGLRRPPPARRCTRWCSTRPTRGAASTRGTRPRVRRARLALEIVSPGAVDAARRAAGRGCARRRSPARTRDADGSALQRARRPARARRHGPGRGLGPGDPARARRVGARRAGRRRRAAAAARRARPDTWNHTPGDADYFSRGAVPRASTCTATTPQRARASRGRAPDALRAVHRRRVADDQRLLAALRRLPRLAEAAQAAAAPAGRKLPASVPILIVGGDLDSLTPLADAPGVRAEAGRRTCEIVTLRNTVHVTSEGDNYLVEGMRCARTRDPLVPARRAERARARRRSRALHTPRLPADARRRRARDARLRPRPGRDRPPRRHGRRAGVRRRDRSAASTRAPTAGPGLRGGAFTARGRRRITLRDVRFVSDATVDGDRAPGTPRPAARRRGR